MDSSDNTRMMDALYSAIDSLQVEQADAAREGDSEERSRLAMVIRSLENVCQDLKQEEASEEQEGPDAKEESDLSEVDRVTRGMHRLFDAEEYGDENASPASGDGPKKP